MKESSQIDNNLDKNLSTEKLLDEKQQKKFDTRVIAIYIINFLLSASFANLMPFFPNMAEKKGVTQTYIGIFFSCNSMGSFLLSFVMAKYMRYLGRKRMIITGIIIQIIVSVLIGTLIFIENKIAFITVGFLTRFMQGAGWSLYSSSTYAIMPILYPDSVQKKIGNMESFSGLGFMIGPFIGSAVYYFLGYQGPFYLFALFFIIALPVSHVTLPSDAKLKEIVENLNREKQVVQDGSDKKALGVAKFLFNRKIFSTFIIFTICSVNLAYLGPTLEIHMEDLGVGPSLVGIFFVFGSGGYIITVILISNYFVKKFNRKLIIASGVVLAILAQLLIAPEPYIFPRQLWIVIFGQFVLGPAQACQFIPLIPELMHLGADIYPGDSEGVGDLASGIFNAGIGLGNMTGPFMGGTLVDYIGFENTARVVVVINIVVFLQYMIFGDAFKTFLQGFKIQKVNEFDSEAKDMKQTLLEQETDCDASANTSININDNSNVGIN